MGSTKAVKTTGANALASGKIDDALDEARRALAADPANAEGRLLAARALARLGRLADSADELRRGAEADPLNAELQLELGYAMARRGDFSTAVSAWDQYLKLRPGAPSAERVRSAVESAMRLYNLIEAHTGV